MTDGFIGVSFTRTVYLHCDDSTHLDFYLSNNNQSMNDLIVISKELGLPYLELKTSDTITVLLFV